MADFIAQAGLHAPDYDGGSILNLMASVIQARGGVSPHRPLRGLDIGPLRESEKLLYLVIDGLGWQQWQEYCAWQDQASPLRHHPPRKLTTVFPATTASAVTTFDTGASPTEHAILGWYLNLPDLGMVTSILPCQTRTGMELAAPGFDLGAYLQLPSHTETVPERRVLISYDFIPQSRYSQASSHWHERHAHKDLKEMRKQVLRFLKSRGRALAYVYWPGYDSLCHQHGTQSDQALGHLAELEGWLADITPELVRHDAHLLVTADHGLWDCSGGDWIDLARIPGLYDCLATLPAGDSGHVQLFVRPRQEARLKAIIERELAQDCDLISGTTLLESGILGPGTAHAQLGNRVGDWVLLARPGVAFQSSLPQQPAHANLGNHGGMQAREMEVPLFALGAAG